MTDTEQPQRRGKGKPVGPFAPLEAPIAVTYALKALAAGTADADQQKRALQWIVETAGMAYDWPYFPTDRDTCIALGRQFVGKQIVKEVNLPVALLKKRSEEHG